MIASNGEGDVAMFGPDPRRDGPLASRGWAHFRVDASEPRDVERFLFAVHLADRERVRDALDQALRQEGGSFSVEFHTVHPGGQQRLICARGKAERSESAETVRLAGVLVDITETGPASRDEAPHANAMTRMTHARFTHISLLLGSLTHELNQPLMAILSNAEAGMRFLEAPAPDFGELRSIFREICADNQRAVAVIRKLRSLYQSEKLVPEAFDLNDAVREVARLVHNHLVIQNVGLTLHLNEGLPAVRAHRVQIEQVLLNLIYNACEAMEDCVAGDRNITVCTETTDSGAMVSVVDPGKGIDKWIRDRVFEPFFTTKPAGMGMGLDVCKSIVEAHGGKLWFRDGPVRGAIFSFMISAAGKDSP